MRTMRKDLAAAGIPYVDGAGRKADFHALRGTFMSGLAVAHAHPRTIQALGRLSTVELAMQAYTDLRLLDTRGAVSLLPIPDLTAGQFQGVSRHVSRPTATSPRPAASGCAGGVSGVGVENDAPSCEDLHETARRVVGAQGFEPRTYGLKGRCSTIELRPRVSRAV